MKSKVTILPLLLLSMLFLFSCKDKEEVKNPCANGYLDIGEVKIDCGGNCEPCPTVYIPSVQLEYNGTPLAFSNKSLTYSNNVYSLQFYNDSLQFQINLGGNDSINTYPVSTSGTFLTKSNTQNNFTYSSISNATCAIISNNKVDKRMSGLFSLKFFQSGGNDTIRISYGGFNDMAY